LAWLWDAYEEPLRVLFILRPCASQIIASSFQWTSGLYAANLCSLNFCDLLSLFALHFLHSASWLSLFSKSNISTSCLSHFKCKIFEDFMQYMKKTFNSFQSYSLNLVFLQWWFLQFFLELFFTIVVFITLHAISS